MKRIYIATISILIFSCHFNRASNDILAVESLPSFDMLLLDSVTHIQAKEIPSDKPLMLIYFRPNCPHCQAETKKIVNNIEAFKDVRIYFLAGTSIEDIRQYVQKYNLYLYSNILVCKDFNHSFAKAFKVRSIPCLAIYNDKKNLVKIYKGEAPLSSLI